MYVSKKIPIFVPAKFFSREYMDIKKKKCLVFDLDGTVYLGNQPIPGTIDFIRANTNDYDIYFMTNNTSKTPDEYVKRLKMFDIYVKPDQIISPFNPLFNYLKDNNIKSIYLMANEKVSEFIQSRLPHISFTDKISDCQAIVLTFDTELTYNKLKTASLLLQNKQNIKYLATHHDNVCPTNEGNIPDVGGFMKLIEITTGRMPEIIFGKPNKELLSNILLKYKKEECAIVGDRIYTDKKLADNSGIDFILVLSGETKREDVENLNNAPALIINDLGKFNK